MVVGTGIIQVTDMNRKNQSQTSTERILKSKYLEKDKPNTMATKSNLPRKVMLTDLCAQEKLKVGELIKINETCRTENRKLLQELNEIRLKFSQCQSRLSELERQFEEKDLQCHKMNTKILLLQQSKVDQQISAGKLKMQLEDYRDIIDKINRVSKDNRGIQTDDTVTAHASIQTKNIKQKNRSIQVEYFQEPSKNQSRQIASREKNTKQKQFSLKRSHCKSNMSDSAKHSCPKQYDEEDGSAKSSQQEMGENFDELAQKWLTLKQQNIAKLKRQYKLSKDQLLKDQFDEPSQFHEQSEEVASKHQNQSTSNELDDAELNRMLKSKNFSASRLINSKGFPSENKAPPRSNNCLQSSKMDAKKILKESVHKVQPWTSSSKPSTKMTMQQLQSSKRGPTNVYQSDLMDLVDAMNL